MSQYELSRQDKEELQEYLISIKNYKSLTYTELDNLLHNQTSENQQKFIIGSLKTAAKYSVKLYKEINEYFPLPYSIMDFIQLGNEALIKLVYEKKYDNYKKFIWKFAILLRRNIINNLLPISLNTINKYKVYIEKRDEFLKKYQHEASNQEMMDEFGYQKLCVNNLKKYLDQNQGLKKTLNTELITDGYDYIGELVEYLIVKKIIAEVIESINIKERYREIIVKYFGLTTNDYKGDNLICDTIELAEEYNVSKQRIHQIIYMAFQKIKQDEEAMKKLTLCKEIVF